MASSVPIWKQRRLWTAAMALAALAFWVVGLGAGMRGWILAPNDGGIVAHAQSFGEDAYIWWIPATVLTLTAVMMAMGTAIVRHLVEEDEASATKREPVSSKEKLPKKETSPKKEPLSEKEALPKKQPAQDKVEAEPASKSGADNDNEAEDS